MAKFFINWSKKLTFFTNRLMRQPPNSLLARHLQLSYKPKLPKLKHTLAPTVFLSLCGSKNLWWNWPGKPSAWPIFTDKNQIKATLNPIPKWSASNSESNGPSLVKKCDMSFWGSWKEVGGPTTKFWARLCSRSNGLKRNERKLNWIPFESWLSFLSIEARLAKKCDMSFWGKLGNVADRFSRCYSMEYKKKVTRLYWTSRTTKTLMRFLWRRPWQPEDSGGMAPPCEWFSYLGRRVPMRTALNEDRTGVSHLRTLGDNQLYL